MGSKWYMIIPILGFTVWGINEIFSKGNPVFGGLLIIVSAIYYCADELVQIKEKL